MRKRNRGIVSLFIDDRRTGRRAVFLHFIKIHTSLFNQQRVRRKSRDIIVHLVFTSVVRALKRYQILYNALSEKLTGVFLCAENSQRYILIRHT